MSQKHVSDRHNCDRQLLRLPPFPLSRLEVAFSEGSDSEQSREEQELRSAVFLKDVHMSMIRVLEGSDVGLLEPPTLAGYGSAAELYPKNIFRYVTLHLCERFYHLPGSLGSLWFLLCLLYIIRKSSVLVCNGKAPSKAENVSYLNIILQ